MMSISRLAVLCIMIASLAQAATLSVNPGGSIQTAIYAASPGDVVLVHGGTYYDHLKIGKPLTLKGIGKPVLDATASGSAITLDADGIWLEGFRIMNSGSLLGGQGAGITVLSNNNTITGNNVSNNFNGIYVLKARKNRIYGNIVSGNLGFGIRLEGSSNNTIYANSFINNYQQNAYDDGLNLWDNSSVGNYYSDFICPNQGDGICNSGHSIPGGRSMDRYPLIRIL